MNTALRTALNSRPDQLAGGLNANWAGRAIAAIAVASLAAMALLPVTELVLRTLFATGIPGNSAYVQNLSLWVGFGGAVVAAYAGKHLTLATRSTAPHPSIVIAYAAISVAVVLGLAWASFEFMKLEMESPVRLGGWLPVWLAISVLPAAFVAIAMIFARQVGSLRATAMVVALATALMAGVTFLDQVPVVLLWAVIGALLVAAVMGTPIFVVLGGLALALFTWQGVSVSAIPVEAYRIVVSPAIPTIPLFVLTGYLLSHGDAGTRLVRLFQALFGWLPGGLAIVVTLVAAFFSTFTGASGVTILALGGLLLPVLVKAGYSERFSLGLVTASGSIGLLFPPSLAVILYGVVAHVPIPDLFLAGIGPGVIMVAAVCVLGVFAGWRARGTRQAFNAREAAAAIWQAKWEIGLPVVALFGIFGGLSTLTEAAAVTAVYAFVVQTFVNRDINIARDLPPLLLNCVTLVGAIFAILAVAMGLTNFLVDADIPAQAAALVERNIESRFVFLLALNVFLLAVGSMMDIYAATVVVVPLIAPIAQAYGIHPLHLGMIFLVNLELGYLTPPVGMNLFLSAIRFEIPVMQVCRAVAPFLATLLVVVLLVTYLPELTLVFVDVGTP